MRRIDNNWPNRSHGDQKVNGFVPHSENDNRNWHPGERRCHSDELKDGVRDEVERRKVSDENTNRNSNSCRREQPYANSGEARNYVTHESPLPYKTY